MRRRKSTVRNVVKQDSAQFEGICRELLNKGVAVSFSAHGESMRPNILPHDRVLVAPVAAAEVKAGDVVLARGSNGLRVHRVVRRLEESGGVITRGDAGQEDDAQEQHILGRVMGFARNGKQISMDRRWTRHAHAARTWLRRIRLGGRRRLTRWFWAIAPAFILFQLFAAAAPVQAVRATLA